MKENENEIIKRNTTLALKVVEYLERSDLPTEDAIDVLIKAQISILIHGVGLKSEHFTEKQRFELTRKSQDEIGDTVIEVLKNFLELKKNSDNQISHN